MVSPEAELGWLLQAATGMPRAGLTSQIELAPDAVTRARELASRRAAGEPLQYITGLAGFRFLELQVGPGVFIPRPETELVVERALARLPRDGIVADLCTGSGAIALSIASERPDAAVYATELSPDAFRWAERNRAATGIDVVIAQGDLFSALPEDLRGRLDVVVSNPPYVPPSERRLLPRDVVDHEPPIALFAEGDGLEVIRRLIAEGLEWLKPGGWLVLEIGETQGESITRLLGSSGYEDVAVHLDHSDRERIAEGRR